LLDRTSSGGGRDHSARCNSCSPNFFLFRKSMVSSDKKHKGGNSRVESDQ
jgi:hypothetical protein